MKRKILVGMLLTCVCISALTGCSTIKSLLPGSNQSDQPPVISSEPSASLGVPEDEIEFDLQAPSEPVFQEGFQEGYPGDSIDLDGAIPLDSEQDDSIAEDDLFVVDGDYAYRLDPHTLEKVGGPLDPVTHEPVEVKEQPQPDADVETPSATEPTDETKYPNTGIFVEDD